jgi:hypothetical protein
MRVNHSKLTDCPDELAKRMSIKPVRQSFRRDWPAEDVCPGIVSKLEREQIFLLASHEGLHGSGYRHDLFIFRKIIYVPILK